MNSPIERSWCDLPADILNETVERLLYVEQIRFRSVCKNWRSNTNPTKHAASKLPWVMSFKGETSFYLHDPSQKKSYFRHNKILSATFVHASKHGWLLLSDRWRPHSSFFFYTPFTDETIQLPRLNMDGENKATFSTPPTSPGCVVFVLTLRPKYSTKIYTSTWSPGDTTWRNTVFDVGDDHGFILNLAFSRGAFYCLFSEKVMGSFKVAKQEWKIHPLPFFGILGGKTNTNRFLFHGFIECHEDGSLLVICRGLANFAAIFRYDQSKTKWLEVERLENGMLFCGPICTAMLLPALEEASELANSIHLIPNTGLAMCLRDLHHWDNGCSSCYFYEPHKGQTLHTYDWIDQNLWRKVWIQPPKHT